jgi:hypothetical protein
MSDDNKGSSAKWWVLGGVAAVGVACAGAYLVYSSGGKKKTKKSKKTQKPAPEPVKPTAAVNDTTKKEEGSTDTEEFGRDQLVAMFRDMVTGMQEVIFHLAKMEQHMRQQKVSQEELVATLSTQYRDQMQRIQIKAFEKYKTNEEQAERASEKYHDDPEFKELLHQMDVLNNALTAGVPPPDPEKLAKLPASLTCDRTIEIFTDIMETMTEAMVSSVMTVKEKHAPNPPPQAEIDQLYLDKIKACKDDVLLKYQLDSEMLDIALQKYASDPRLSETMMALQSKQQVKFMELQASLNQ